MWGKDNIDSLSDTEVLVAIEKLTHQQVHFWRDAGGWAPVSAAALLDRSMLDWQASLATSLKQWVDRESDGDLILALANLGSLAEGAMKLMLAVFYEDYVKDQHAPRRHSDQTLIEPDELMLGKLCALFGKRIWEAGSGHAKYLTEVMERRNAIHAFKKREIGTFVEFKVAARQHLRTLRYIDARLPYP